MSQLETYDLGFFDHETYRITRAENPCGAEVFYVPGIVTYVIGTSEREHDRLRSISRRGRNGFLSCLRRAIIMVLTKLLDGFEGKLTTDAAVGRSTSYSLATEN